MALMLLGREATWWSRICNVLLLAIAVYIRSSAVLKKRECRCDGGSG
jgi:hypothetical protein